MKFSRRLIALAAVGAALLFLTTAILTRVLVENDNIETEFVYVTATRKPTDVAVMPSATHTAETPPTIVTSTSLPTIPPSPLPTQTLVQATATPQAFPTATILSASNTPPLQQVRIMSEVGGWLRGGPGVDYEVVGEVLPGSVYEVLGYQNREANLWYLIRLENGQPAWVSGQLASPVEGTGEIAMVATIPPTPLPTSTITATPTATPPTNADAYVAYERDKLRLRSAPDRNAEVLDLLAELTPLTVRGRTADDIWLNVVTLDGQEGWVMAEFVTLNLPLGNVPIAQVIPTMPPAVASAGACISVVGDSMPYGDIVYMIPDRGFMTVQMKPFSAILTSQLAGRNITVVDRTAPATYISSNSQKPYMQTPAYQALLQDKCLFTVITPWINDLNLTRADSASVHVDDLVIFMSALNQANPNGKILLLGFYYGQPAEFTSKYATGYTSDNVNAFNQRLFEACAPGGRIAVLGNVTCQPLQDALWAGGSGVFSGAMQRDMLLASLHGAVPPEAQPLLDDFWNSQPQGAIVGDGIHLSEQGKTVLAQFVISQLMAIDPNW